MMATVQGTGYRHGKPPVQWHCADEASKTKAAHELAHDVSAHVSATRINTVKLQYRYRGREKGGGG